jgi:alpha-glucuronidase
MQRQWNSLEGKIDAERFQHVKKLIEIQYQEANWWRESCLLYFQTFSKKDFPQGFRKPGNTLEYYKSLEFPFAPGIRPKW